jgi:tripartite-type tricarboxylate transporter receptor subunit TctC
MMRTSVVAVLAIALLASAATCAQPTSTGPSTELRTGSGQAYPNRPLRMIVPSAPGGLPDIQARLMANELGKQLGQLVVVDNRPGASFIVGFDLMAKATPDGYTVGYASFPISTNPSLFANLPYNFERDFRPVIYQVYAVNILAVSPSLPIGSVQELISYARANPDKLSYGTSGFGATNHLSIELIKMMTGVRIVAVSYKGIQQAISEAISGQIHVVCDNMGSIMPHVKAGRMRGLGITSPKRSPAIPELPTVSEAGLPDYEITPWSGYVVPKQTSTEIVRRLNAEINKALFSPAVSERLIAIGSTPVGGTPEQFAEHVRKETAKWAQVIKSAGIKPQ